MIQLEKYFVYVSGEDYYERTGKDLKIDLSWFETYSQFFDFCYDLFQFSNVDDNLVFTFADCPLEIFPESEKFLDPKGVQNFFYFRHIAKTEQELFLMMNGVAPDMASRVVCVGSESDYENYIREHYYENYGFDKMPMFVADAIDWDDVYFEHKEEVLLNKVELYNGSFAWIE